MLVSEILSVIKNDNILINYLAEIPKKYQKTQVQLLSALDRLGYLLYLNGHEDDAVYLLEKLAQVEYDGNYNYWGTIENTIVLLAFIKKDVKENVLRLKSRIENAINSGDDVVRSVKAKVHSRFLKGVLLGSREENVKNAKDEIAEIENRIILLGDLFRLYLFLDDADISRSEILEKIDFNLNRIRSFIELNSIKTLFPFR
ncbi:TPA: hypothetical protein QB352_000327 [Pasteurella multocida]|nr:hypothetical protein [Pasteurella multocida]